MTPNKPNIRKWVQIGGAFFVTATTAGLLATAENPERTWVLWLCLGWCAAILATMVTEEIATAIERKYLGDE